MAEGRGFLVRLYVNPWQRCSLEQQGQQGGGGNMRNTLLSQSISAGIKKPYLMEHRVFYFINGARICVNLQVHFIEMKIQKHFQIDAEFWQRPLLAQVTWKLEQSMSPLWFAININNRGKSEARSWHSWTNFAKRQRNLSPMSTDSRTNHRQTRMFGSIAWCVLIGMIF